MAATGKATEHDLPAHVMISYAITLALYIGAGRRGPEPAVLLARGAGGAVQAAAVRSLERSCTDAADGLAATWVGLPAVKFRAGGGPPHGAPCVRQRTQVKL